MLADICSTDGGLAVFVHQSRANIGAWFSGPIKTAYGKGTDAVATCRLRLWRKGYIRRSKRRIGIRVRVEVLANVNRPPGRVVWLDLIWGKGFRESASMLDLCVRRRIIRKEGNWYRFDGGVLGHGRDEACSAIEGTSSLWRDLKAAL